MAARKFKHAPLVEAIVELHWCPANTSPTGFDPYSLLAAHLHERLSKEYPEYEALPGQQVPEAMARELKLVQHRFRKVKDGWPLVQLGPGVFTLNETEGYDWDNDFRSRAVQAVTMFTEAFSRREDLRVLAISLRYIDALLFDWSRASVFDFLKKKLRTTVLLPCGLFEQGIVGALPEAVDLRTVFSSSSPEGKVNVRFATGQSKGSNALILETMVQSGEGQVPRLPDAFAAWLDGAHAITSAWFKKLTEGELASGFDRD